MASVRRKRRASSTAICERMASSSSKVELSSSYSASNKAQPSELASSTLRIGLLKKKKNYICSSKCQADQMSHPTQNMGIKLQRSVY